MSAQENAERRGGHLKERLLAKLHEPLPLKICVMAAVLAAGYFGVYQPLKNKIDSATAVLNKDKKLIELATKHEKLSKEYQVFEKRIPAHTDTKEWMQYVLDGIRRLPVKLGRFDCSEMKTIEPFKMVTFQIELDGSFYELRNFLKWVEENQRLLRVDEIAIMPSREPPLLNMRVTLLGLGG